MPIGESWKSTYTGVQFQLHKSGLPCRERWNYLLLSWHGQTQGASYIISAVHGLLQFKLEMDNLTNLCLFLFKYTESANFLYCICILGLILMLIEFVSICFQMYSQSIWLLVQGNGIFKCVTNLSSDYNMYACIFDAISMVLSVFWSPLWSILKYFNKYLLDCYWDIHDPQRIKLCDFGYTLTFYSSTCHRVKIFTCRVKYLLTIGWISMTF